MDLEKIKRSQFVSYLDVAPDGTPSYKLLGQGVTSYAIAYNPQITTEKYIIHDGATNTLDSYQKQGDVSQKCYKGDPCFEFINKLRRTNGVGSKVQTTVLDIDKWDAGTAENSYKATKQDVIIAVTSYMGEDAVIEYTIYYNGDPIQGEATIANGTPTFTAAA